VSATIVPCKCIEAGEDCGAEGVIDAEAMCEHEHKMSGTVCRRHVMMAAAGEMRCPLCHREGYRCFVRLLTPVPL